MTDLDRFLELYRSFGIKLEVVDGRGGGHVVSFWSLDDFGICLYTAFDKDGKFIRQDFYD